MRAVFLDRDGVISENRNDHVKSWEEFHFLPGALDAIAWLRESGFPLFVVTNQAIVNRGVVSAQATRRHSCTYALACRTSTAASSMISTIVHTITARTAIAASRDPA